MDDHHGVNVGDYFIYGSEYSKTPIVTVTRLLKNGNVTAKAPFEGSSKQQFRVSRESSTGEVSLYPPGNWSQQYKRLTEKNVRDYLQQKNVRLHAANLRGMIKLLELAVSKGYWSGPDPRVVDVSLEMMKNPVILSCLNSHAKTEDDRPAIHLADPSYSLDARCDEFRSIYGEHYHDDENSGDIPAQEAE